MRAALILLTILIAGCVEQAPLPERPQARRAAILATAPPDGARVGASLRLGMLVDLDPAPDVVTGSVHAVVEMDDGFRAECDYEPRRIATIDEVRIEPAWWCDGNGAPSAGLRTAHFAVWATPNAGSPMTSSTIRFDFQPDGPSLKQLSLVPGDDGMRIVWSAESPGPVEAVLRRNGAPFARQSGLRGMIVIDDGIEGPFVFELYDQWGNLTRAEISE